MLLLFVNIQNIWNSTSSICIYCIPCSSTLVHHNKSQCMGRESEYMPNTQISTARKIIVWHYHWRWMGCMQRAHRLQTQTLIQTFIYTFVMWLALAQEDGHSFVRDAWQHCYQLVLLPLIIIIYNHIVKRWNSWFRE